MNHSPSGLLFSQCIDGFVKYKNAEGLSRRTVESYELILNRWMEKMGDKLIGKVTPIDMGDYLAICAPIMRSYLRQAQRFQRKGKGKQILCRYRSRTPAMEAGLPTRR